MDVKAQTDPISLETSVINLNNARKSKLYINRTIKAIFCILVLGGFILNYPIIDIICGVASTELIVIIILPYIKRVSSGKVGWRIWVSIAILIILYILLIRLTKGPLFESGILLQILLATTMLFWASKLSSKALQFLIKQVRSKFSFFDFSLDIIALAYLLVFTFSFIAFYFEIAINPNHDIFQWQDIINILRQDIISALRQAYLFTITLFILEASIDGLFILLGLNNLGINRIFKTQVVSNYFKKKLPDLKYSPHKGIIRNSFNISCLLATRSEGYSSEDYFKGTHNNIPVVISEVETSEHEGLMLIAKIPKKIKGYFIMSDAENGGNASVNMKQKIKVSLPYFKDNYLIYSNNEHLKKALLNKAFETALSKLNSKDIFINFSIINHCIYIAIEKEKDLLDFDLNKEANLDSIKEDFSYFNGCLNFLDLLLEHSKLGNNFKETTR